MIEFLCPNGHKIHCPAEQAGRAAKCPRCGVRFQIPEASELDANAIEGRASDSRSELADVNVPRPVPQPARPAAPQEEQIEFLCPNGHRLHGPASLQGRPGECPECGSRFRVPVYDEEVSEEEELETDISVGGVASQSGSGLVRKEAAPAPARAGSGSGSGLLPTPRPTGSATAHPLAAIFARLWVEKARGGIVELHLSTGEKLVPDQFSRPLSQPTHGVFAVKEADGSLTVTVISWDSVQRLVVRGVKKMPQEP